MSELTTPCWCNRPSWNDPLHEYRPPDERGYGCEAEPVTTPHDARGVEITPGAWIVYGALSGRSVNITEAEVEGDPYYSKTGRIRVRPIRRRWTHGAASSPSVVAILPDRLIVVNDLPTSTLGTVEEAIADAKVKHEEWERQCAANEVAHTPIEREVTPSRWSYETPERIVCENCGVKRSEFRYRKCVTPTSS